MEAARTAAVGAEKGARTPARLGYRSGYYDRTLITRVGKLELRVPQDRAGRFSTEPFERDPRSEKALGAALAELDVQGVSTRKAKAITEELCGHGFSAAAIGAINVRLDEGLAELPAGGSTRPVRISSWTPVVSGFGRPASSAARRCCWRSASAGIAGARLAPSAELGGRCGAARLAVELATRESRSSRRDFLLELRQRSVPRKVDDDGLRELRWLYDRRDFAEARRDLAAWLTKWQATYPKLCAWVEEHIEQTLTFYRLPRQHPKPLKSTDEIERLNEEIKRRTHGGRIFPHAESGLRLIRALAVERHENWLEAHRYLDMDDLREHKEALRMAA